MTSNLHKILKAFAKELTLEVTKEVTEKLRESYVQDITAIVKDCLKNNEFFKGAETGFMRIEDLSKKYGITRRTISAYCTQFQVSRNKVGKHNLVNELEFFKAFDNPAKLPDFLKDKIMG